MRASGAAYCIRPGMAYRLQMQGARLSSSVSLWGHGRGQRVCGPASLGTGVGSSFCVGLMLKKIGCMMLTAWRRCARLTRPALQMPVWYLIGTTSWYLCDNKRVARRYSEHENCSQIELGDATGDFQESLSGLWGGGNRHLACPSPPTPPSPKQRREGLKKAEKDGPDADI